MGKGNTKHRHAEGALFESETRFRSIFENVKDVILFVDKYGKILNVNKKVDDILGYKQEEVLGKNFAKLGIIKLKDLPKIVKLFRDAIRADEKVIPLLELALKHKNGTWVNIEAGTTVLKKDGETIGTLNILRDITERTEEKERKKQLIHNLKFLSESSMKFVEITPEENIHQLIADQIYRLLGNCYVLVNSYDISSNTMELKAITGIGKQLNTVLKILGRDLIGMSFIMTDDFAKSELTKGKIVKVPGGIHGLSFGKLPKKACSAIEKVLGIREIYSMGFARGGKLYGNAVILLRNDFELKDTEIVETFMRQASVALQRKQVEEELKNALSEWDVTFNATKDSTMLIDDKFKIFKANFATERFLGKHLNEILGGTCYELVHGTDAPPDTCPLKTAKHTKKHEGIELYVPEKNVWLSATVDPILDDKGNLTRAVHIIKDITERKQAEGKIKEQNIQLKKLDKIKSDFLNVTSHELRTPMSAIKGYLQMLLNQSLGEISEEQKKGLEVILRNANRLDNLVQDILDVSRLESGTMKFIIEKTDIQKLVDEVTETMQSSADLKDIKINMEVEEKLPGLNIDQDRIKQVIINLVNNSIKFSPGGSIINIRAKKEEGNILFEVQDFGRGIPKDKQDRIFETFYQVDSGKDTKFGGAGLGLAISRGILLAHSGKIWVKSKEGKGSTFSFTLPIKPVKDLEERFKDVDMFLLEGMGEGENG